MSRPPDLDIKKSSTVSQSGGNPTLRGNIPPCLLELERPCPNLLSNSAR